MKFTISAIFLRFFRLIGALYEKKTKEVYLLEDDGLHKRKPRAKSGRGKRKITINDINMI